MIPIVTAEGEKNSPVNDSKTEFFIPIRNGYQY